MIMMIKITNLNKHFNKGSINEINVINDTTLEFPRTGLVSITGPSGCGKTTLLNVIGGLDSFESGSIDFDGEIIKKYNPLKWDIIRNNNVGYIFQNYSLIEDKTVYENIEIALNMAGLYEKEEIEDRIDYVLEAVGMKNYRKRNVLALSGGQRQRVGIARALAKNPKVILADEPTGNLDANNTFDIMGIIKKISQTCLVILVSHERTLVEFYSDRIIQISDGQVVRDYLNEGKRSIERVDERDIYLKDLKKVESKDDDYIERYYEIDKDDSLEFTVVEVKNSIYVKAKTKSRKKIKFLTRDTEINLIDDHYKATHSDEALKNAFDMHKYGEIERSKNKKSFIRLRDSFVQGFRKVTGRRKFLGKLLILVYFIISAIVVYQLATFANLTRVEDSDFLTTSKDLILVESEEILTSTDINDMLDNVNGIEFAPYQGSSYFQLNFHDFYQGDVYTSFDAYPVKSSWVDQSNLIYGEMPDESYEIVIDKWIADELMKTQEFLDLGVDNPEILIGQKILENQKSLLTYEIVGIVDTGSPIIVVKDEAIYSFTSFYMLPYGSVDGIINIESGRGIQAKGEILMPTSSSATIGEIIFVEGEESEVVGLYTLKEEFEVDAYTEMANIIIHNSYFESLMITLKVQSFNAYEPSQVLFYSTDMGQAINDLSNYDTELLVGNSYELFYQAQVESTQARVQQRVISIMVTLGGIVVYIFFMMRSSMLNRIKEVGTYRAIGATKRDIHKIFIGEIFWFTTLGSLPGYIVMTVLINNVQNTFGDLVDIFYFPPIYFIGGIIGIYLINFIFGMLPIANLLRKTPSQISAKFDI